VKVLGLFKILKGIGTKAYKLDLPATMKIHPVFPVELLKPALVIPCIHSLSFTDPLSSSSGAKKNK
jgi:hypothetical protein